MSKLFEGKYDRLTGIIVDALWYIIKESKKVYDKTGDNLYKVESIPINDIISFNLQVLIQRKEGAQDFFINGASLENIISLVIYLDPDLEPDIYSDLNIDLQTSIRHELEHILQEQRTPYRPKLPSREEIEKLDPNSLEYFLSDYETAAMVHGFYRNAKNTKRPLDVVIDNYLRWFKEDGTLTNKEVKMIKNKWFLYAKEHLPKAQYKNLVSESLNEYIRKNNI